MEKGKCYSQCNRGQRNKNDMYQTPYSISESLFENEVFDFDKKVLEPACGDGAIVRILLKYFNQFNINYYDKKIKLETGE